VRIRHVLFYIGNTVNWNLYQIRENVNATLFASLTAGSLPGFQGLASHGAAISIMSNSFSKVFKQTVTMILESSNSCSEEGLLLFRKLFNSGTLERNYFFIWNCALQWTVFTSRGNEIPLQIIKLHTEPVS
jgi:hypothetical protein